MVILLSRGPPIHAEVSTTEQCALLVCMKLLSQLQRGPIPMKVTRLVLDFLLARELSLGGNRHARVLEAERKVHRWSQLLLSMKTARSDSCVQTKKPAIAGKSGDVPTVLSADSSHTISPVCALEELESPLKNWNQ